MYIHAAPCNIRDIKVNTETSFSGPKKVLKMIYGSVSLTILPRLLTMILKPKQDFRIFINESTHFYHFVQSFGICKFSTIRLVHGTE